MCNRPGDSPALQAEALDEAFAHVPTGMMALNDGDLQDVTCGVADRITLAE